MIIPVWRVTVKAGKNAGKYIVKGGNREYASETVYESLGLSVLKGDYGGLEIERLEDEQTANISGEGNA